MYSKLVLVGNVGRDPNLRNTPDGTAVCDFSVAVNRKWGSGDSQGEETTWYRVTTWRRMAEVCAQYLRKGRQVLVEGQLKPDPETGGPRVYQKSDGSYGAQFEVTASVVKFLGGAGTVGDSESTDDRGEESIPF